MKKFVTNMMMLIVAMTAMIGSIYLFCTTDRDRDHDELRDKELIYNKRVTDSMLLTNLLQLGKSLKEQ